MYRFLLGASLVLLVLGISRADEPKKNTTRPGEVIALFHDGTKVRMVILQDKLEVTTKYGKLTVPAADVRRVEFGFRVPEETARKLEEAIANLGSPNFPQREAATKELTAMGRLAYPALMKASKNNDLETTKRVEDILKEIRQKVPADQLRSRTDDLIHTTDFVIAGRIDASTLKARSDHFGEVQIKVVDLRSMYSTGGVGEAKVTVDAATYGSGNNQWMDTGYNVSADTQLAITATGEIDLYGNNQPGMFLSGPDGNRNVGRQGAHIPGMLLGRIGEEGPVFIVSKKYEGTSVHEGKLYLRIVPIQNSGGSTGNYQVKITSGNTMPAP
jgi:hypothetical protein